MMKKIAIGIGALFALFVIAAIVVPLVVDVDKYRPQIVEKVDQSINGKLELGKLSLSLWGKVRVEIAGLVLTDPDRNNVVAVKDAYLNIPFSSILSGSPEVVFSMDHPELNVVKEKNGKLNLLSLMKTQPGQPSPGQPAKPVAPAPTQAGGGGMAIPGIVARARLGVDVKDALLNYHDLTQPGGTPTRISDLNLVIKDLSLSHPTDIQLWANLKAKESATLAVSGPVRLNATADPHVVDGRFDHVALTAKLNLDDLDIAMGTLFHKGKGIPANADLALTASQKEARIDSLVARFFNAEIKASGTVSNLGAAPAAPGAAAASPVVRLAVASNEIDLKPWNELVPMLKDYELSGNAQFTAQANGPSDKLAYDAGLKVNALKAKAPNLKAEPRVDADVHVVTNEVDRLVLSMKAPGNDLEVRGKILSFAAPKADFTVGSSGMNLDQLIDFPPPGAKAEAKPAPNAPEGQSAPGGGEAKPAKPANYDAMVAPLANNKMLANTVANVGLNIKSIQARGVKISDIVGKVYLRNLAAGIEGFAMKLWSGTVKANAVAQLRSQPPTYRFGALVDSLDLAEAVDSQYHLFKNTLLGKAHFQMTGEGKSFNTDAAISNLSAKGNLKVTDATFASIDVGKMASDALNNAIAQVAQKVPGLAGKTVHGLPNGSAKYQVISTDFTIAGGKLTAPNFVAKSEPQKGIDLKGSTAVGLKDYSLDATWYLVDTYNLTGAHDLSGPGGTPHILAEGNNPVQFPVQVGGTLFAPKYSYASVPQYLAKVAVSNMTGAAKKQAQAALQNQIQKALPQSAPPAVQKNLQDLGNKLFGH